MDEFDVELPDTSADPEPPASTPEPGEMYRRIESEPALPVVYVDWQHPKHKLWAAQRVARGLEAPFYVRLPSGELGWVPWPGSKIVAQQERAWEMDLFTPSTIPDLKKGK